MAYLQATMNPPANFHQLPGSWWLLGASRRGDIFVLGVVNQEDKSDLLHVIMLTWALQLADLLCPGSCCDY